jgi:serine/threonine protein kinase
MLQAVEIADALAYLHSNGVVHGDLNGNNVLLRWALLSWLLRASSLNLPSHACPLHKQDETSASQGPAASIYMPP